MTALSAPDRDLWRKFRRISEQINVVIERDLLASTQLSGADHGILSRLAENERKSMRQQQLCNLMRWDRTRLSHHLTRMERRNLVKRSKLETGGTLVSITAEGDLARKAADPVHGDAVMRHFVSKLSATERELILRLAETLTIGS